jgi:hypothetical protein
MTTKKRDRFASLRRANEQQLDQHADLIESAQDLASTYTEKHEDAATTLIDALARTYALVEILNFHKGVRDHDEGGILLRRHGIEPDKKNIVGADGCYSKPVHALVKALFSGEVHKSQITRWAQVITFLHPDEEELARMDNANHQQWIDLFKTKLTEYGGTLSKVQKAWRKKVSAEKQADQEIFREFRQKHREELFARFIDRAERFSIPSTTAPIAADTVVILRPLPDGRLEAIPLPGTTARLEQLVIDELRSGNSD